MSNSHGNSVYKLNRCILNKRLAVYPLEGPSGLIFPVNEKVELFTDSLEVQFTQNPGPDLPEVSNFIFQLKSTPIVSPKLYTTLSQILSIISKLPRKKAPGEDHITNPALKFLPKTMILVLTNIINNYLRNCYFLNIWKKAIIITILKPRKYHKIPFNYKPIALLSAVSKLYEKVILRHIRLHIVDQIRSEQSGFRSDHSTTQQLTSLVDKLSRNLNNQEHIIEVFLDVEKFFDRVWREGFSTKCTK